MKECAGPRIEPVNVWLPGGHASDPASGPGPVTSQKEVFPLYKDDECLY